MTESWLKTNFNVEKDIIDGDVIVWGNGLLTSLNVFLDLFVNVSDDLTEVKTENSNKGFGFPI